MSCISRFEPAGVNASSRPFADQLLQKSVFRHSPDRALVPSVSSNLVTLADLPKQVARHHELDRIAPLLRMR